MRGHRQTPPCQEQGPEPQTRTSPERDGKETERESGRHTRRERERERRREVAEGDRAASLALPRGPRLSPRPTLSPPGLRTKGGGEKPFPNGQVEGEQLPSFHFPSPLVSGAGKGLVGVVGEDSPAGGSPLTGPHPDLCSGSPQNTSRPRLREPKPTAAASCDVSGQADRCAGDRPGACQTLSTFPQGTRCFSPPATPPSSQDSWFLPAKRGREVSLGPEPAVRLWWTPSPPGTSVCQPYSTGLF